MLRACDALGESVIVSHCYKVLVEILVKSYDHVYLRSKIAVLISQFSRSNSLLKDRNGRLEKNLWSFLERFRLLLGPGDLTFLGRTAQTSNTDSHRRPNAPPG